ncbi:MAG: polysaccharide deacetylase family protein [Bacteroidales bacterium]
MNPRLKAPLQQLNFLLGRNPRLERRKDWRSFIPEPYKAVVIISADFELAWAWRYSKITPEPLKSALNKAKQERENLPNILAICEQFNIPITWITVGHLFLESCIRKNGVAHPELPRIRYFENEWWSFQKNDWFEHDPCTDLIADPLWYCPDLIKMILDSKVKHEIGCHTFSHIDCRDEVCTPEQFRAEINATLAAAEKLGIKEMESFAHPGHTIGNLDTLASMGFTNFRTDYANILGYPVKHENGLWEFSTTLEFEYKVNWSESFQIYRYISTVKRAIRNHSLAYFWFHPSCEKLLVNNIIPHFFDWLDRNRNVVWITGQGKYIEWLNQSECK